MMEAQAINSRIPLLVNLASKHLCPECSSSMKEVDRVNENGFIYIWYECNQPHCNGQWLEKKPSDI